MSLPLVRTIAPELADVNDVSIGVFLELAAARISASVFGNVYGQAVAYLAAHLATISQRAAYSAGLGGGAGAGAITSVSTGGLAVSFGASASSTLHGFGDEALATTPYGLEFINLRSTRAATRGFLVIPK